MEYLHPLRAFAFLFLSILFFTSCEDDDPCEECQAAINHMCEKIQDNSCNPDFMANAVSRLREDCGTATGNDFAGYMMHTCEYETVLDCPTCNHVDGAIVSSLSVVNVDYTIIASNLPEEDYRLLVFEGDTLGDILTQVTLYQADTNLVSEHTHRNGSEVYLALAALNLDDDGSITGAKLLTDRTETFDLYRPGKWFNPRTIRASYDDFSEQYLIEFIDW